jgi:hypothetical protein
MPTISVRLASSKSAAPLPPSLLAFPVPPDKRRRPEDPILVPIEQFRPTQGAVGMKAVAAKREKVARRAECSRKIERYLEKRPIPAVLGPGAGYYIIDHHHLSMALHQNEVSEAFVRVIGDLSRLPRGEFWRCMAARGCLHPYDHHGQRIHPSALPSAIRHMKRDAYRDLSWSVREAGGFVKSEQPYAEFRWAQFFRSRLPRTTVLRDFEYAHDRGMMLARSQAAVHLPGFIGIND